LRVRLFFSHRAAAPFSIFCDSRARCFLSALPTVPSIEARPCFFFLAVIFGKKTDFFAVPPRLSTELASLLRCPPPIPHTPTASLYKKENLFLAPSLLLNTFPFCRRLSLAFAGHKTRETPPLLSAFPPVRLANRLSLFTSIQVETSTVQLEFSFWACMSPSKLNHKFPVIELRSSPPGTLNGADIRNKPRPNSKNLTVIRACLGCFLNQPSPPLLILPAYLANRRVPRHRVFSE